jgi:hypothetical protein
MNKFLANDNFGEFEIYLKTLFSLKRNLDLEDLKIKKENKIVFRGISLPNNKS